MTEMNCCVKGCKNSPLTSRGVNDNISFHVFPRDPGLKKMWIEFCGQKKNWIPKPHTKMCSTHFKRDNFDFSGKDELLNIPSKPKLNKSAVPTILVDDRQDNDVVEEIVLEYCSDSGEEQPKVKCELVDMDHMGFDLDSKTLKQEEEEVAETKPLAKIDSLRLEIANLKRKIDDQEQTISKMKVLNESLARDLHNERHRNLYLKNKVNLLEGDKTQSVPNRKFLTNSADNLQKPILIIVSNDEKDKEQ